MRGSSVFLVIQPLHPKDGTGLTQYCIGQILLETGRAKEAEAKFLHILSGRLGVCFFSKFLWKDSSRT